MRVPFLLLIALWLLPLRGVLGQTTEEEKKLQFLKAREEMKTLPMTPSPEKAPRPKPRPRPSHPTPEATPRPRQRPEREPEVTPKSRPRPTPEATPRTHVAHPPPVTLPLRPTLPPKRPAPLVIEKSGFEQRHGYQPAPPAGWFEHWKYLTKSVRAEIDHAPVLAGRWRYIVVHNSGTRQGNAKAFDYYHRYVRKMPNGLAYQFVVGNGTSSGDGEIEIGDRWRRQINGGHVHSDYLNSISLGICLVGDFNRDLPTRRQLEATEELIRYLRRRVGKIDHHWSIVRAHREINPPRWPTDCPGNRFPYQWLHGRFDQPGT